MSSERRSDDLHKARRESAELIGLKYDRLSPADVLRCDLISTLRLVIDDAGGSVLAGGSADLGKLITATEALIGLMPGRELPKPEAHRQDPREVMWRTYLQMRERGGIPDEGTLQGTINAQAREIEELRAEVARWRASISPAPESSSVPSARPAASAVPAPAEPPKPVPNAPVVARPAWQTKEQMDAANARAAAALASAAPHKTNRWDAAGGRSAFTVNGASEALRGYLRADGSWQEF
jgi:hypothetical protein